MKSLDLFLLVLSLSGMLAMCCLPGDCQDKLPESPYSQFFGSGIQRTMSLLACSNPWKHNPVSILVYGQSITGQGYIDRYLKVELPKLYPDARISIENRSIGGYEAPRLVRTSSQDMYPVYPDLIIFQDYGGNYTGELERMLSNVRRYTTSEFMILTHHVDAGGDANAQHSKTIRELAAKYGCELADMRSEWNTFLKEENLEPKALLSDSVHLNDRGGDLMARLVARHFVLNPYLAKPWGNIVRTYEARRPIEEATDEIRFSGAPWKVENGGTIGIDPKSALVLDFVGNRIDVVFQDIKGKLGTAKVLIDGKAPSSFISTWATTRSSTLPDWWFPCVDRITLGGKPVVEDWSLNIHFNKVDGTDFTFEAIGSVTGKDGTGNGKKTFVSNSGIIRIDPMDYSSAGVYAYRKVPLPKDLLVKWSVYCMGLDVFKPVVSSEQGEINRITIVKGLPNGQHELRIIPNGNGPVPVKEVIIHDPPMASK